MAVDVTHRSALGRSEEAQPNAAEVDGAILSQARLDKEQKYPELLESGRCRLVVVAIQTGGRWSDEAVDFIWQLAAAKARESPSFVPHQTALAWEGRWTRMLSTVCAIIFCCSAHDGAVGKRLSPNRWRDAIPCRGVVGRPSVASFAPILFD